jgi:hypothetical protein
MLTAKQRDMLLSFERDSEATDLCDLSGGFQISCGVQLSRPQRNAAQSSDPSRRLTSNSRKKTLTVSGRSGAATLSDAQAKARFGARAIQNRVKWRSGNLRRVFPIGFDGTRRARDE